MPNATYTPVWRPEGRLVAMRDLASTNKSEALSNALTRCMGWQGDAASRRAHYFRWRRSGGHIVRKVR